MISLVASILLGFCGVFVGILAIRGDAFQHAGSGRYNTRGWLSMLCLSGSLVLIVYKETSSSQESDVRKKAMEDLSAKIDRSRSAPLNSSELREMDVGISIDRVMEKFGPPQITQKHEAANNATLHYARWYNRSFELQTLSIADKRVVAFVVRLVDPIETYVYVSSPIEWNLGSSTYATINANPGFIYRGGDAKFVTYVEHAYLGRWGHYNDFFFCSNDSNASADSKPKVDRNAVAPTAVCVTTSEIDKFIPGMSVEGWRDAMVQFVGIHGARYEE